MSVASRTVYVGDKFRLTVVRSREFSQLEDLMILEAVFCDELLFVEDQHTSVRVQTELGDVEAVPIDLTQTELGDVEAVRDAWDRQRLDDEFVYIQSLGDGYAYVPRLEVVARVTGRTYNDIMKRAAKIGRYIFLLFTEDEMKSFFKGDDLEEPVHWIKHDIITWPDDEFLAFMYDDDKAEAQAELLQGPPIEKEGGAGED